jgi:hypothetical protein
LLNYHKITSVLTVFLNGQKLRQTIFGDHCFTSSFDSSRAVLESNTPSSQLAAVSRSACQVIDRNKSMITNSSLTESSSECLPSANSDNHLVYANVKSGKRQRSPSATVSQPVRRVVRDSKRVVKLKRPTNGSEYESDISAESSECDSGSEYEPSNSSSESSSSSDESAALSTHAEGHCDTDQATAHSHVSSSSTVPGPLNRESESDLNPKLIVLRHHFRQQISWLFK